MVSRAEVLAAVRTCVRQGSVDRGESSGGIEDSK
jgi:hypothetical protein